MAFADVGWKYYLVFILVPAVSTPLIWFKFPETKGLSLEEIGAFFGDEMADGGGGDQDIDEKGEEGHENKGQKMDVGQFDVVPEDNWLDCTILIISVFWNVHKLEYPTWSDLFY